MILHLSQALAKRLKCRLSLADAKVNQLGRVDSWSADIFRITRLGTHALIMHDASLWPIILPLAGCTRYEDFLQSLLLHIEASCLSVGGHFDRSNLSVIATKRSNRSIIGSMNEAKFLLGHYVGARTDDSGEVDWAAARDELAQTPFTVVEGHFPDKRFAQLVVEGMRSGE
jgi:hypothetical protein